MEPKVRVDVVVLDEEAQEAAAAVAKADRTGAIGDGKIWVGPVEVAVRLYRCQERYLRSLRQIR